MEGINFNLCSLETLGTWYPTLRIKLCHLYIGVWKEEEKLTAETICCASSDSKW